MSIASRLAKLEADLGDGADATPLHLPPQCVDPFVVSRMAERAFREPVTTDDELRDMARGDANAVDLAVEWAVDEARDTAASWAAGGRA
ncbi:hypothetical protein [Limnoglobus roseus]|uniref:Uncharacterized protein n=1 Tax=Limnoglobus roseus TaxID=2598579 RepID=A0A5C1AHH0_9BACT|nr:hypothetical protein [Limnoglobus roseus]QEL17446.1 hypothetical protein PX52LOC_04435 [Limnoglobus roseus]